MLRVISAMSVCRSATPARPTSTRPASRERCGIEQHVRQTEVAVADDRILGHRPGPDQRVDQLGRSRAGPLGIEIVQIDAALRGRGSASAHRDREPPVERARLHGQRMQVDSAMSASASDDRGPLRLRPRIRCGTPGQRPRHQPGELLIRADVEHVGHADALCRQPDQPLGLGGQARARVSA